VTDSPEELTVEQLTARTGLAYTTVRLYQQRGLLPPPIRRGRVGYYGPDHLARIRLIAQLQERGYSLAAIKDLVDTWQDGRTLPELLGLEGTIATFEREGVLLLSPTQLAAHFAGVAFDTEHLQRAAELQLISLVDDQIAVHSPTFLEVGSALVALGISVDQILDEYANLKTVTADLARRFTELFERNLWAPFAERQMPADEMADLTGELRMLGPLAERIVTATLRGALVDYAAAFIERKAAEFTAERRK
jgi:DNA-binding transcriptional MerR regulator